MEVPERKATSLLLNPLPILLQGLYSLRSDTRQTQQTRYRGRIRIDRVLQDEGRTGSTCVPPLANKEHSQPQGDAYGQ